MKLKKGDLVLINNGEEYYDSGVISDITDEEAYIQLFNMKGELNKYTTRHPLVGEDIRKTTLSTITDLLVKCSTKTIIKNIAKLRSKE